MTNSCFDNNKVISDIIWNFADSASDIFASPSITYPTITLPCHGQTLKTIDVAAGIGTLNTKYAEANGQDTLKLVAGDYELKDASNPNN